MGGTNTVKEINSPVSAYLIFKLPIKQLYCLVSFSLCWEVQHKRGVAAWLGCCHSEKKWCSKPIRDGDAMMCSRIMAIQQMQEWGIKLPVQLCRSHTRVSSRACSVFMLAWTCLTGSSAVLPNNGDHSGSEVLVVVRFLGSMLEPGIPRARKHLLKLFIPSLCSKPKISLMSSMLPRVLLQHSKAHEPLKSRWDDFLTYLIVKDYLQREHFKNCS